VSSRILNGLQAMARLVSTFSSCLAEGLRGTIPDETLEGASGLSFQLLRGTTELLLQIALPL